ncbi:MAG: LEA type 2 family protein [Saprospiraceae bacterium]|uniref:LEA type 2 family protein n=1 Tax=Candidatus Opimibacter skivensis TaxID=2982028 RepID=A0A9D7XRA2_9BACT|nr:LEA type 2 family protein [Candidatus Opimibacter skivensis]
MRISAGTIVVGGGLVWGGYWLWRKSQLATSLQISLDGFSLPKSLRLRFRNAAGAGVTVNTVFLNLYLGNVKIAEINSKESFFVEPRSQTTVTLNLDINFISLMQTAASLVPVIMSVIGGGPIPKNLSIEGWISAAGNQMLVKQALT